MSFGPLEFAAYLRRKDESQAVSPAVRAARAAAPVRNPMNTISILSGPVRLPDTARAAQEEPVSVYEALAAGADHEPEPIRVLVRQTARPAVVVLSSHRTVRWQIELDSAASLAAVLLSGYGESTVAGAGAALIGSIGGFYAFKRGSPEFRHLEREVLRCTGRNIGSFHSVTPADGFLVG